jgi:predicted nuclease of predicted toxin-antitoxin system
MKLLFDENLSPKLVRLLDDHFPGLCVIPHSILGRDRTSAYSELAVSSLCR